MWTVVFSPKIQFFLESVGIKIQFWDLKKSQYIGLTDMPSLDTSCFTTVDTPLLWTLFVQPSGVHISVVLL